MAMRQPEYYFIKRNDDMKTALAFLPLFLLLHLTNVNAQSFVESECGIISNSSYSYNNYHDSNWIFGFKLYHNSVLIAGADGSQTGKGYQVTLLKFIADSTGYFIYSSRQSIATSYSVNKIIGNKIIHLCDAYNIANLYIVNSNLAYLITYSMDFELIKCSDIQPKKSLKYGKPTSPTSIVDTIIGMPLCQDMSELNISYDNINFKILFHIIGSTNSISENNISQWNIFPNPADDYIHFTTNAPSISSVIKIYNSIGILQKSVISNKISEESIYVGDLISGVYFIEINQGRKKYLNKMKKK